MEDSGIDSDGRTANGYVRDQADDDHIADSERAESKIDCDAPSHSCDSQNTDNEVGVEYKQSFKPMMRPKTSSILQKHLEKRAKATRKFRMLEQNSDGLPKKLIPRNRLKVPKSQNPVVSKMDSHPLVSWESGSDEDDFHPISKPSEKELSEQLIQDGYDLDLTPDEDDLDLIPPKPVTQRCVCCSVNFMCVIQ